MWRRIPDMWDAFCLGWDQFYFLPLCAAWAVFRGPGGHNLQIWSWTHRVFWAAIALRTNRHKRHRGCCVFAAKGRYFFSHCLAKGTLLPALACWNAEQVCRCNMWPCESLKHFPLVTDQASYWAGNLIRQMSKQDKGLDFSRKIFLGWRSRSAYKFCSLGPLKNLFSFSGHLCPGQYFSCRKRYGNQDAHPSELAGFKAVKCRFPIRRSLSAGQQTNADSETWERRCLCIDDRFARQVKKEEVMIHPSTYALVPRNTSFRFTHPSVSSSYQLLHQ